MQYFFSCDWGTSSFRLRLVQAEDFKIIAESGSTEGIAVTHTLWQSSAASTDRVAFYLRVIKKHIDTIIGKTGFDVNGVPVLLSGMASSSIGFLELPYQQIPLKVDGADFKTAFVDASYEFEHLVFVISGLKTDNDVVRGEETQLAGAIELMNRPIKNEVFIIPGTHSKHIWVNGDTIIDAKTYMTGEFFELLSQKSILSNSVELSHPDETQFLTNFNKGVQDATHSNILNSVFKIRTARLLGTMSKKDNFSYLSGLLIGSELKDLLTAEFDYINLLADARLKLLYIVALNKLKLSEKLDAQSINLEEGVIRGQYKIYLQNVI
jgi:2-dehydro-3-deoxygalactonokinase